MAISKTYTRTWPSVDAIKRANRHAGQHFFDADTLRFFDSKVGRTIIGDRHFITSERFHGSDGTVDARRYSVRIADDAGRIDTVGEFQAHATSADARKAALAHAAEMATGAELAARDASLGVGHVWTATHCPAYRTYAPSDCTCTV